MGGAWLDLPPFWCAPAWFRGQHSHVRRVFGSIRLHVSHQSHPIARMCEQLRHGHGDGRHRGSKTLPLPPFRRCPLPTFPTIAIQEGGHSTREKHAHTRGRAKKVRSTRRDGSKRQATWTWTWTKQVDVCITRRSQCGSLRTTVGAAAPTKFRVGHDVRSAGAMLVVLLQSHGHAHESNMRQNARKAPSHPR